MSDIIDRLWDKEAIKYDIDKIPVEIMLKENFRQAMLEALEKQRELSAKIINRKAWQRNNLSKLILNTKLEEQK